MEYRVKCLLHFSRDYEYYISMVSTLKSSMKCKYHILLSLVNNRYNINIIVILFNICIFLRAKGAILFSFSTEKLVSTEY